MASFGEVVSEWLERAMRETGQTNKSDLAIRANIARSQVYEALGGAGWPSRETVDKLAAALGIDPPAFILARPEVRETPLSWIGEAELALSRARRLLDPTALATIQRVVGDGTVVDVGGGGQGGEEQPPREA